MRNLHCQKTKMGLSYSLVSVFWMVEEGHLKNRQQRGGYLRTCIWVQWQMCWEIKCGVIINAASLTHLSIHIVMSINPRPNKLAFIHFVLIWVVTMIYNMKAETKFRLPVPPCPSQNDALRTTCQQGSTPMACHNLKRAASTKYTSVILLTHSTHHSHCKGDNYVKTCE